MEGSRIVLRPASISNIRFRWLVRKRQVRRGSHFFHRGLGRSARSGGPFLKYVPSQLGVGLILCAPLLNRGQHLPETVCGPTLAFDTSDACRPATSVNL